jgi:hypothetical protein
VDLGEHDVSSLARRPSARTKLTPVFVVLVAMTLFVSGMLAYNVARDGDARLRNLSALYLRCRRQEATTKVGPSDTEG